MDRIIYANGDAIVIKTPTQEGLADLSLIELAVKDTPTGLPFWIVSESDIPANNPYLKSSWNLGEPDGYGD